MDAEARHRILQLLGIELRAKPRRPYPGQKYRHGWIPVSIAGIAAKWHRDLTGFGGLVATIDSGEAKRFKLNGGLMGDVFLVDYNNGTTTIEKNLGDVSNAMGPGFEPERQADAEQLAAALGRTIGAPVPRVLRTGDSKIAVELVDGDTWRYIEDEIPDPTDDDKAKLQAVKDKLVTSREGIRLGLLDLLLDNWDRANSGNWIVEDDTNRPVGIDHAFAWSEVSDVDDGSNPPNIEAGPFAELFLEVVTPAQGWRPPRYQWKDNPLTPDDIDWLLERLAGLEDDFERLGRHDWWEFAFARIEAIAPHASGEESVFA